MADETLPADAAEMAALIEAAEVFKRFVPPEWRDPRMDAWREQCRQLEESRRRRPG